MQVKRSLSALDLVAIAVELRDVLRGGRVDRVYEAGQSHYIRVRSRDEYVYLVANPRRFSRTWTMPSNLKPSPLRRLIEGCVVEDLNVPLDRVVDMVLNCGKLHIELVPPFNIVYEEGGSIRWVLRNYEGKDRVVKPGLTYTPPPRRFLDPRFFDNVLAISQNLNEEYIARNLGIGLEWAREVCYRSRGCGDVLEVWRSLRGILESIYMGKLTPTMYSHGGQATYISPIRMESLSDGVTVAYQFNKLVDEYFSKIELTELSEEEVRKYDEEVKRLEASLSKLERDMSEYEGKARELRAIADAIMSNLYDVEAILNEARERYLVSKGKGGGQEELRVGEVKLIKIEPAKKTARLSIGDLEFEAPFLMSPGDIAGMYYEEAKKLEKKAESARAKLEELKSRINQLKLRASELSREFKESVRIITEREWFERFRWFITSGDVPVLAGKDATQNEILVKRYMRPWDIFMHADVQGGPVTLVKVGKDGMVAEADIVEAAKFAAAYSKAWKLGANSVDVYYVRGEQVSKKAPSGEYLSKGGFMIYGQRGWVRGVELSIGVGVRVDEGALRLVSAPDSAIGRLARYYVILRPGNMERSEAAARIRDMFKERITETRGIPLEHLIELIPGPSVILGMFEGNPVDWGKVREVFNRAS